MSPGDQGYVSWVSPGDQGYVSWVRPGDQGYVSYTRPSKNIFLTVLLAPGMSALNPSLGRRETILQREQFQGNKTGSRELFSASHHSKQQIISGQTLNHVLTPDSTVTVIWLQ